MTVHDLDLSDRQARAVIAAAEAGGFEREPHLLWWRYDEALYDDASAALGFLRQQHPEQVDEALAADDPLPVWVAVERIMDERGGINLEQVRLLIEAAVGSGLMNFEPDGSSPWAAEEWQAARGAVELLWQNDFDLLKMILGDHVTLAMVPDSAVHPCPAVCEGGWIRYRFAGDLPVERPAYRSAGAYSWGGEL